ncbi:hypothetical protein [Flammeovirga sp. SubArs3]|uniref:SPOR domain-containing protein n=1 Tax=Flammeovirga sp. SubArs3 TaxID=2995316 RepID=UPI00248B630E|nr:hypothetical protein [Flammeovirga sp. SubArs3]
MKQIKLLTYIFLFISLGFTSCAVEQFSEEKPFSIKVASFREFDELENTIDRLEDLGLEPYAITQVHEDYGKWHHILLASELSLEDVLAKKMNIEDTYGLNNLEVQNYNKVASEMIPLEEDQVDNFPVTWTALDLLSQLPYSKNFVLKSAKSLHYYEDINVRSNTISRNVSFDFPRGISIKDLQKNAEEIVEGKFKDPLSRKELTVHIVKLKEKNKLDKEPAKQFAEKILDSRRYNVKKMSEFKSENNWGMTGYEVTVNPKGLKSYVVQQSASGLILAFVQCNENDLNLMKHFVNLIGDEKSIDSYNSMKRLLGAFPDIMMTTERLVAFDFFTKESLRGRNAMMELGETGLQCYFENSEKGTLVYQLENFNDQSTIDKLFKSRYESYLKDKTVDKVLLGNRDAFIYKVRRRDPSTRKMGMMAESLIFQNDKEIGKISNFKKGTYQEEELIQILSNFRLGDEYQLNRL